MSEANGFSGFRQVPMGFDKNQVNEYITDLRKKMLAMEADMKANNEKVEEAQKLADEADQRIKDAVKVESDKVSELTMQLNREKERGDNFTAKVNELKKQLEDEKQKMTDMLKSGKGVSSEAQKAYTEILDKANADAAEIVNAAKAKADVIVAEAEQRKAEMNSKLDEFLAALRGQVETINTSYGEISSAAGSLLGASAPAAVSVPDFSKLAAPAAMAAAPVAEPAAKPTESVDEPEEAEAESGEVAESLDDIMSAFEAVAASVGAESAADEPDDGDVTESLEDVMSALEAIAPPAASTPEPKAEPAKEEPADSMPSIDKASKPASAPATFDDAWGGSELAQTIYNNEMNGGVPLVNPDAKDAFGQDLFGMGLDMSEESSDEMSGDLGGFDLSEDIGDIQPLDTSDHSEAAYNKGFNNDLLAQTMHSSSLSADADSDLLAAVKAQEAAFEVKPNISMDDDEPETNDTEDLMQSLRDAEAALSAPTAAPAADPWADLQAQLDAMELSGAVPVEEEQAAAAAAAEEPEIPSPDDSSIWDLGGTAENSSDDDDMMSGDFGGFGF